MTAARAASLYMTLRRDLARPPARRPGESTRIAIEGRTCTGRKGKPCGSRKYHVSRARGPVCASCGKGWPTKVVVESVRGSRVVIQRERSMDIYADLGRAFASLPTWQRRVFYAWELDCYVCRGRVPHHSRRWRQVEVARHLAEHFPRSGHYTTVERVAELYESASDAVAAKFVVIERSYGAAA